MNYELKKKLLIVLTEARDIENGAERTKYLTNWHESLDESQYQDVEDMLNLMYIAHSFGESLNELTHISQKKSLKDFWVRMKDWQSKQDWWNKRDRDWEIPAQIPLR